MGQGLAEVGKPPGFLRCKGDLHGGAGVLADTPASEPVPSAGPLLPLIVLTNQWDAPSPSWDLLGHPGHFFGTDSELSTSKRISFPKPL